MDLVEAAVAGQRAFVEDLRVSLVEGTLRQTFVAEKDRGMESSWMAMEMELAEDGGGYPPD